MPSRRGVCRTFLCGDTGWHMSCGITSTARQSHSPPSLTMDLERDNRGRHGTCTEKEGTASELYRTKKEKAKGRRTFLNWRMSR